MCRLFDLRLSQLGACGAVLLGSAITEAQTTAHNGQDSLAPSPPPTLPLVAPRNRDGKGASKADGDVPNAMHESGSPIRSNQQVEFRADRAVVEPAERSLLLEGDVRAACGRYQLRAERLRVQAEGDGAVVEGPAVVTLCPCKDAPVSVEFDRARIDPPSDLVVEQPRLRLGNTTVFAFPAAWLRTADQPGLLPPRVAWRGTDGLLLGQGFHLPWRESNGHLAALQLYVSGYTSGGVEIEPTLTTSTSRTRFRFDRVHGDLVELEAWGSARGNHGRLATPAPLPVLVFSADLARGERSPEGLVDLRRAVRRFDSFRTMVAVRSVADSLFGTGVEGVGARGSEQPFVAGPLIVWASGGRLGSVGVWEGVGSSRLHGGEQAPATHLSRGSLSVELNAHTGPLRWSLLGRGAATAFSVDNQQATDLAGWSRLSVGMPIARRSKSAAGKPAWVHILEPYARTALLRARTAGIGWAAGGRPVVTAEGAHWMGTSGLRTTWGPQGGSTGLSLAAGVGGTGELIDGESSRMLVSGVVEAAWPWFGLEAEGAGTRQGETLGAVGLARARIGAAKGLHLRSRLGVRSKEDPVSARLLALGHDAPLALGWLDAEGTSVAIGAGTPLGRGVGLYGDTDLDAERGEVLAVRGGVGYGHPCGCLSATSWVGRRVGRGGVDAWIGLDLAPFP